MYATRMEGLMENVLSAVANAAQHYGHAQLGDKMLAFSKIAFQKGLSCALRQSDELNALCHGDLWCNNILFEHAVTNDPVSAIIVDFQGVFWGSPILDVVNIFFSSSSPELRAADWYQCVDHYHGELVKLLGQLKYPKAIPTLGEFKTGWNKRVYYSLSIAFLSLCLRHFDGEDDNIFGKFLGCTEEDMTTRNVAMLNPKIRENMEFLLAFFNDGGYLD